MAQRPPGNRIPMTGWLVPQNSEAGHSGPLPLVSGYLDSTTGVFTMPEVDHSGSQFPVSDYQDLGTSHHITQIPEAGQAGQQIKAPGYGTQAKRATQVYIIHIFLISAESCG